MTEEYLKNPAINRLLESPIGDGLRSALETVEKIQLHLYALAEKNDEKRLTAIKIGTVLTLSVLRKLVGGKRAREFSQEDWTDIANAVSKYAILTEDRKYSEFVFLLYADYIDASDENIEGRASEKTVSSVRALAEELRSKTELLENEQIAEVTYTEDCLWICLEAMIKLIASVSTIILPVKKDDSGTEELSNAQLAENLSQAIAVFSFEYGRYLLYKNEKELLSEYIRNQYALDEELEQKYAAFKEALNARSDSFRDLINNTFSPNFRDAFLKSAELAQAVGVDKDDVLCTVNDIDDFFMN